MAKLSAQQVKALLDETVAGFPHLACLTCECFLGLTAQLSTDTDGDGKNLLAPYKIENRNIHHCLGCDPCPPGDLYAAIMREKRKTTLICI
jgi:hypothetical protein